MQENRSFDSYFGTFPGADGIPRDVCVPDPRGGCVTPFHDPRDRNFGGPHALLNAARDIDKGAMDGFVGSAVRGTLGCVDRNDPYCVRSGDGTEVMGYHDAREIPNYWAYARNFVLQDHMFEPNASWSLPAHLSLVSEWSAECAVKDVAASCRSAPEPSRRAARLPRRPEASTPARSSSRTTSSTGSASTRRRTGAPTHDPACARCCRFSATSRTTSTSRRSPGGR
jgi:phospholipase C